MVVSAEHTALYVPQEPRVARGAPHQHPRRAFVVSEEHAGGTVAQEASGKGTCQQLDGRAAHIETSGFLGEVSTSVSSPTHTSPTTGTSWGYALGSSRSSVSCEWRGGLFGFAFRPKDDGQRRRAGVIAGRQVCSSFHTSIPCHECDVLPLTTPHGAFPTPPPGMTGTSAQGGRRRTARSSAPRPAQTHRASNAVKRVSEAGELRPKRLINQRGAPQSTRRLCSE
jgi:hypothetical protein